MSPMPAWGQASINPRSDPPMLETVILNAIAFWGLFFLVNHADLFSRVRNAVMPVLPRWLAYPIQCAFCASFWTLAAFSLFTGWTPMILWVPPCVLFVDQGFRGLTKYAKNSD